MNSTESWDDWIRRGAAESFCYLTTMGRRTGKAHTIEIWFAVAGQRVYVLSERGEAADWVRNLMVQREVGLRLGGQAGKAVARVVRDPEEGLLGRRAIAAKYEGWQERAVLPRWVAAALPVALEPFFSEEVPGGSV
jgi:deazaflavin-dependent oxidoreductase (nitroreductase family)